MDKVASFVFNWWNWGVHKLVSLSEEHQIGEHVIHYKYAAWIILFLCLLGALLVLALLTLSAMGILPNYSWWLMRTCFVISSLSILPWFLHEQFYQEVKMDYTSLNILYGIAAVWGLGFISMCVYIISRTIQFVVGICCPLPGNKDHYD